MLPLLLSLIVCFSSNSAAVCTKAEEALNSLYSLWLCLQWSCELIYPLGFNTCIYLICHSVMGDGRSSAGLTVWLLLYLMTISEYCDGIVCGNTAFIFAFGILRKLVWSVQIYRREEGNWVCLFPVSTAVHEAWSCLPDAFCIWTACTAFCHLHFQRVTGFQSWTQSLKLNWYSPSMQLLLK